MAFARYDIKDWAVNDGVDFVFIVVVSRTCRSNPCQRGATCVDGLNRYNCLCTYGWAGTNCELGMYTCKDNNAHAHAHARLASERGAEPTVMLKLST